MEGQGNCVRVTGLAKKREAEAMVKHLQQPKKKKVVLAEIQHLSNQMNPKSKQTTKRKVKGSVNDEKDKEFDPQMCSAYVSDIICDYLHQIEIAKKRRPLSDYLEKIQKDVSANMRGILVDWLVEVAEEYKLLVDT